MEHCLTRLSSQNLEEQSHVWLVSKAFGGLIQVVAVFDRYGFFVVIGGVIAGEEEGIEGLI